MRDGRIWLQASSLEAVLLEDKKSSIQGGAALTQSE